MSTKVDYDVTDNLRVRIDVNGEEFNEPETIAELSGHTFPDGHYYERLTIAHAEKMIEVLKRGIESRHPPTVESIRAAVRVARAELSGSGGQHGR